MECIFCGIIAGRIPAQMVLSDRDVVAFLDRSPLFPGHVLVVPRRHHETLLDLPDPEIGPLFEAVKRVTGAVTRAMNAEGTFVAMNNVVSQSVPHAHVHVVPRRKKDGLKGFFWPRSHYTDDAAMAEVAIKIRGLLTAPVGDDDPVGGSSTPPRTPPRI